MMARFYRRAAIACLLSLPLVTPALCVTTYDGTYQVDITTEVGSCTPTGRGTVTVSDGIVVSTSDSSVRAFGRIGADGVASFAFHRGSDVAHVSGRLKGAQGGGAWSEPTQQCGGRWRATKLR
jgi:hypothetical protein